MDFVHDQLFDGRKIRILTTVDTFSQYAPAIDVKQSYRGVDVVETLDRVARHVGYPKTIRLDNSPEFVSKELDLWAYLRRVTLDFSRPSNRTGNTYIESLKGTFRVECLTANWFMSLGEARKKCKVWRQHYNKHRPHRAIGHQVPIQLHLSSGKPRQSVTR